MEPIINPNLPNYIQHKLNTDHFVSFSNQLGGFSTIKLSDYTIVTDKSILPFEDYVS